MNILLIIIFLVLVYYFFIRDIIDTWGATADEAKALFPGDDIIPNAQGQATRAITINAPVDAIWPWLLQLGQGRGGFYSYDGLENLIGLDIHSADSILPQHQQLEVGSDILFGKNGPVYKVVVLEQKHALILQMTDSKTLELPDPNAPDFYTTTWGFILEPIDAQSTRFITRGRAYSEKLSGRIMNFIFGNISCFMEQKMLRGVKSRAEQTANTTK
jgi:hypothetical protein